MSSIKDLFALRQRMTNNQNYNDYNNLVVAMLLLLHRVQTSFL